MIYKSEELHSSKYHHRCLNSWLSGVGFMHLHSLKVQEIEKET